MSTPGTIRRPLLTVSGTLEQLAPIDTHARAFRREVVAAGNADRHRLYEVQNGGHVDRLRDSSYNFTQLEYVMPHAQQALDLLKRWVETGQEPPPANASPAAATSPTTRAAPRAPNTAQSSSRHDMRRACAEHAAGSGRCINRAR